jgi:hypothetical protein
VKAPDTATLPKLATRLLALNNAPIDSVADFRRALSDRPAAAATAPDAGLAQP